MPNPLPAKLTPKQEKFCRAMITEPDQSSAYRKAYSCTKAKPSSINVAASKMMADPKIALRVKELQDAIASQAVMEKREFLERAAAVARADVRKMFDTHGNPIEIPDLDSNEAAAVAGFEFFEEWEGKGEDRVAVGVTKKYKLLDKIRALELVGKAYGYLKDTGPVNLTLNQLNDNRMVIEFVRPA